MKKATLVVMAAGIGSRFGGGIKQLEPIGPNGEIIMDYSIYDAILAGFNKIVFVIRKDIAEDFEKIIGNRIAQKIEVVYAYQELSDIPEGYEEKLLGRTKPWGTGQAILSCKGIVNEPFLVINADDYYGRDAYEKAYAYLAEHMQADNGSSACMVGFKLKNTLSDNGGVTRGICKTDADGMLSDIVETHNILKTKNGAAVVGKTNKYIDIDSEVSMNMWGLSPWFIKILDKKFRKFLDDLKSGDKNSEYLLPTIIGELLVADRIKVKVLTTEEQWFGVTYKEDKELVTSAIKGLIQKGKYQDHF